MSIESKEVVNKLIEGPLRELTPRTRNWSEEDPATREALSTIRDAFARYGNRDIPEFIEAFDLANHCCEQDTDAGYDDVENLKRCRESVATGLKKFVPGY